MLEHLPAGYEMVYTLFAMDGEIGNGGFNQYFYNGLDEDASQQLSALTKIGATQHIQIVQWAFIIHEQEKRNEELQRRYTANTIEAFFRPTG